MKDDLISRQSAIEEVEMLLEQSEDDEHDKTWNNAIRGAINAVKHHVPSAQPKSLCNTCRYTNLEWYEEPCDSCTMGGESNHYKPSAHLVNDSQGFSQGDYISRQDAIDAIRNAEVMIAYDSEWSADVLVESVIEQTRDCGCANVKLLPSAEPKTGEWEFDPNGMDWNIPAWRCSECGYVASHIGIADKGIGSNPMNWAGSKYCPECGCKIVGARMRGEEE